MSHITLMKLPTDIVGIIQANLKGDNFALLSIFTVFKNDGIFLQNIKHKRIIYDLLDKSIKLKSVECVRKLVKVILPELSMSDRISILELSCCFGNLKIVKSIMCAFNVQKYDDISRYNFKLIRDICEKSDNVEILRFLVEKFEIAKDELRVDHNYALRHACMNGHLKIVRYLIEVVGLSRRDFESIDSFAFEMACLNRQYHVVKYFLRKYRFFRSEILRYCRHILMSACYQEKIDVIEYLAEEFHLTKDDVRFSKDICLKTMLENRNPMNTEIFVSLFGFTEREVKICQMQIVSFF